MILIKKRFDALPTDSVLQTASMYFVEQFDGSYIIAKNRYGSSGISIPSNLINKVINNPSGSPVAQVVDWK